MMAATSETLSPASNWVKLNEEKQSTYKQRISTKLSTLILCLQVTFTNISKFLILYLEHQLQLLLAIV